MKKILTDIDGVFLLETDVHGDSRGFFTESYNHQEFSRLGVDVNFVQDNHSFSANASTIRGLHYQVAPAAQSKLVRVTQGAVFDVAVDIRKDSLTFGKWASVILTADSHRQLFVPAGFAHGFCTLVSNTHVTYKVDNYYSKEHERGIIWNDPSIGVTWPTTSAILSDKDTRHPFLDSAEIHSQ